MPLYWNEIKDRALRFSKQWEGERRERAEKDTFWNQFFHVFGISRRRVATFEAPFSYPDSSIADFYHSLPMPTDLVTAAQALGYKRSGQRAD